MSTVIKHLFQYQAHAFSTTVKPSKSQTQGMLSTKGTSPEAILLKQICRVQHKILVPLESTNDQTLIAEILSRDNFTTYKSL